VVAMLMYSFAVFATTDGITTFVAVGNLEIVFGLRTTIAGIIFIKCSFTFALAIVLLEY